MASLHQDRPRYRRDWIWDSFWERPAKETQGKPSMVLVLAQPRTPLVIRNHRHSHQRNHRNPGPGLEHTESFGRGAIVCVPPFGESPIRASPQDGEPGRLETRAFHSQRDGRGRQEPFEADARNRDPAASDARARSNLGASATGMPVDAEGSIPRSSVDARCLADGASLRNDRPSSRDPLAVRSPATAQLSRSSPGRTPG
jgi:hypothetical protein